MPHKPFRAVLVAAALAVGVVGCGHGSTVVAEPGQAGVSSSEVTSPLAEQAVPTTKLIQTWNNLTPACADPEQPLPPPTAVPSVATVAADMHAQQVTAKGTTEEVYARLQRLDAALRQAAEKIARMRAPEGFDAPEAADIEAERFQQFERVTFKELATGQDIDDLIKAKFPLDRTCPHA